MEKFDFHPQEKAFVADANRVYFGYVPAHLADNELPSDVARVVMFHLGQREDNALVFMGDERYATPYSGKVLKNPNTGVEISFVVYKGERIMLEATRYIVGGRPLRR